MTLSDAHALADRRWPGKAVVVEQRIVGPEGAFTLCLVGRLGHDPHAWDCLGQGRSWKEAFASSDRRRVA